MDAIATLTEQNRQAVSPDTEGELVRLRLEEGRRLVDEAAGRQSGPYQAADLFAGTGGLPEIEASQLSADALGAGILHHGGLLVRGLYGQEQLQRLQRLAQENALPKAQDDRLGCSAHTLFELLEVYRQSGLIDAVEGYLGSRPVLFAERIKLRRLEREQDKYAAIPWHQDAAFFGCKSHAVNCWAAVTPCGENNPGLSILPCRSEKLHGWNLENGHAPLDYGREVSSQAFDALLEQHPPVDCILRPGDAVLFDEMTVHQTLVRPWRRDEQVVTISWFFPPACFPGWGTPLAV
jgi:hypothetical protein